ncbi:MAG: PAS domain S-box protein [Prolixibacteraceae bacterium]|nr:PAS domain S-box protein [Prolixibacteraceae bacterium]
MEKHAMVTIRQTGKQKTVKISSKLKPEITSFIIQKWQSLIDVTAKIVGVPSGLIMKLNEDTIEVFIKNNSEENPYKPGDEIKLIYGLYCETVCGTQKQLLVPDATKSKVWKDNNPDVDINMISYLGLPINWPDGEVFGTVCLLDNKENSYSKDYIDLLNQVKNHVETDLKLLVASQKLAAQNRELRQTIKLNKILKNTDKRFRVIFENSLAVMLLIDPETRTIISANKAAEKFYGWKRAQIENMTIDDINILSPDKIKVEMEKARKSERIYFRFKHRLANGNVRDVEVYSSKVKIDGKDYLHSIIHDISEQVHTEKALRYNENILRLFVENSPASIAMFDNKMRYLVYSRRFLADYDIEEKNITGLSHYEVFPEIPERWKEIHRRCLKGEIISADNDPFPRANGKIDWIRWEIRPWYKDENKIGGIILFSEVITEQKEAKEALKDSQAYNRMLFEQSPIGLALTTMDGKLVDINRAYASIIGRNIEEVKQLTYWDITPGKYAGQERKQLKSLEKTNQYGPYEKEYIHKNGHLVPVRLQGLIIERNGEKFIWSSVEDISEQKKAETALIKAKEEIEASEQIKTELLNKLNEAQHNAKIGSWEWDLATGHVWWSDELYRIFELEPDKFTPSVEANSRYVHPDDNEAYHNEVARAIQKKEVLNFDLRIISGTGNLKYCNSKAVVDSDEFGNPVRMSGTFADITVRKKIETALIESETKYRYLFENNPLPMWIYDLHSLAFLEVNEAATIHYGFSKNDFKSMTIKDIRPAENVNMLLADVADSHSSYNKAGVWRHRKKNGEIIFVEIISHLIKYDNKSARLVLANDVTNKKNAEEALRKSEERFRVAQEFSPDGFTILHPLRNEKSEIVDFTWIYENQTIARINKTNPKNVTGKRLLDLFPAHKDTTVFETYIDVANSGKPKILEEVYVGEVVSVTTWLRLVVVPMEEDIAILAQDITERKKAEVALSHSHDLMKYIIEHNQSAVAVLDRKLNYLYVSQRFFKDYRIKENNIIGRNHYEVFPEIPEKWKIVHQKALSGTALRADEDTFYRKDGSFDWTRWECRPWYDADGTIGGIILYLEVITEQKRKEEEIKKLNQRLEILIKSIQQLSSVQSLNTLQDIVAKSARKLIGADGATLVFRENDHCFYVNEDAIQPLWKGKKFPMNSCISGWVMENKQSVVIEDIFTDNRIPQDVYKPTFVQSLAMVPVNVKEPIGAIGNYWKEKYTPTETELQLLQTLANAAARAIENIQLYTELEERVKRRTEQLQMVNKELETFTYSVSHDLKAPLRGIDGYSKLLLNEYGDSLNEEAAHFIKTIRSSTLQMNQLIEDLLAYSRLERSHFKPERIALKSFVETLVSDFSDEIKNGGINIELEIPELEIVTDSTGLSIVLRNLLENAIKFTREKPAPKIEIGWKEKPNEWVISAKDNGVGFDMKYHDRIFEIFQRLHRSEDFPGTGVGLAMVAKAVQRMNGKAWAESSPGEGATFFIELPKNSVL